MKARVLLVVALVAACEVNPDSGGTPSFKPKPKASSASVQTDLAQRLASLLGSRTLAQMIWESSKAAWTISHQALLDARRNCKGSASSCGAVYADGAQAAVRPAIQDGTKAVRDRLGSEATARGDGDSQFAAFIGLEVDSIAATLSAIPGSRFVDTFLSASGSVAPLIAPTPTPSIDFLPYDPAAVIVSRARLTPEDSSGPPRFTICAYPAPADVVARPGAYIKFGFRIECRPRLSCAEVNDRQVSGALKCAGLSLATDSFSITITEAELSVRPMIGTTPAYVDIATCSGPVCP